MCIRDRIKELQENTENRTRPSTQQVTHKTIWTGWKEVEEKKV